MKSEAQPAASTDSCCLQGETPADRVALASALCEARGVRLTELRRQVLELLWESVRPCGAYTLIETLKHRHARLVQPPTVYRALEFLVSQGFAAKIESRNAFVPCAHPERPHGCIFFICDACGESVELEDQRVEQLLEDDACNRLEFRVTRRVIEVEGTCRSCVRAGEP